MNRREFLKNICAVAGAGVIAPIDKVVASVTEPEVFEISLYLELKSAMARIKERMLSQGCWNDEEIHGVYFFPESLEGEVDGVLRNTPEEDQWKNILKMSLTDVEILWFKDHDRVKGINRGLGYLCIVASPMTADGFPFEAEFV